MTTAPASLSNIQTIIIQTAEVTRTLRNIIVRNAGLDGVEGSVLRDCAAELTEVFTNILNQSLAQCTVPAFLNTATIVPVPKTAKDSNHLCKWLTAVIMTCLERLFLKHIKATLPPTLHSHQYAYRTNRSTDDAISTAFHTVLRDLEQRGAYVRLLFVDYSSAVNKIIASRLVSKLEKWKKTFTKRMFEASVINPASFTSMFTSFQSSSLPSLTHCFSVLLLLNSCMKITECVESHSLKNRNCVSV